MRIRCRGICVRVRCRELLRSMWVICRTGELLRSTVGYICRESGNYSLRVRCRELLGSTGVIYVGPGNCSVRVRCRS